MMKARFSLFAGLAGLCCLWTSCSPFQANSDYDRAADFSGFRTYAWMPDPRPSGNPRLDDPLLKARIERAIDAGLAARGFSKSSSGSADFLVGYHVALNDKLNVSVIDNYYPYARWPGYGPYGYGGGFRGGYGGFGSSQVYVDQYEQGTLIIDVADRKSNKLVWRGSTQGRVDQHNTVDKRDQRMQEAVNAILAKFPPGT